MLSDEPKDTAPSEDAPTPKPVDHGDLFEIDLLELFDRHDLPPDRIAYICLYWPDEIFTKLSQETIDNLRRSREFMAEVDCMTTSSMHIATEPNSRPTMRTTACLSQRELMGFRTWTRLEEHLRAPGRLNQTAGPRSVLETPSERGPGSRQSHRAPTPERPRIAPREPAPPPFEKWPP